MPALFQQPRAPEASYRGHREQGKGWLMMLSLHQGNLRVCNEVFFKFFIKLWCKPCFSIKRGFWLSLFLNSTIFDSFIFCFVWTINILFCHTKTKSPELPFSRRKRWNLSPELANCDIFFFRVLWNDQFIIRVGLETYLPFHLAFP